MRHRGIHPLWKVALSIVFEWTLRLPSSPAENWQDLEMFSLRVRNRDKTKMLFFLCWPRECGIRAWQMNERYSSPPNQVLMLSLWWRHSLLLIRENHDFLRDCGRSSISACGWSPSETIFTSFIWLMALCRDPCCVKCVESFDQSPLAPSASPPRLQKFL